MKQIIAFAGSSSRHSINKKLTERAAKKLEKTAFRVLDLNDFDLPIFSVDLQNEAGFPDAAIAFSTLIEESDGIILSLAEHNGSYSAVFKNLFDWLSRIESKTWKNKPMLLMSTSTGARGGASVMLAAQTRFPFHDSNIVASFSLPNFNENFGLDRLTNDYLETELSEAVSKFEAAVNA